MSLSVYLLLGTSSLPLPLESLHPRVVSLLQHPEYTASVTICTSAFHRHGVNSYLEHKEWYHFYCRQTLYPTKKVLKVQRDGSEVKNICCSKEDSGLVPSIHTVAHKWL